MLKLLCLGLFLSLCFEVLPLSAAEEHIVREIKPFPTKEKREMAIRQALSRSREERREEGREEGREGGREGRIVGGEKVSSSNPYPWVANFIYGCDDVGFFLCGTSLIQSNISLSAAHCFPFDCPSNQILGFVGVGVDLDQPDAYINSGIRIILHPGYDEDTFQNDISMLFFSEESFDSISKFARLPSFVVNNNVPVQAAGWGSIRSGGDYSNYLREVTLKTRDDSNCKKIFVDTYDSESQLCAGAKNKDTCQGDSGGPLFETTDCCPFPGSILHGITSYGLECASTKTAVYTETVYYLDWINSVISDLGFENDLNAKSCCSCKGGVEDGQVVACGNSGSGSSHHG